jgi:Zn-finger nucleic acid-binding protein
MDCPVCENAMVTLELAEVEIDHCIQCGGTWLDAGELEVLLDEPSEARRLLDSFQEASAASEKARRCPICRRRMVKVVAGRSQPPLLIDRCRRRHGLWFDRGELEGLLQRGELDEDNRILRLLTDIFGTEREKLDTKS